MCTGMSDAILVAGFFVLLSFIEKRGGLGDTVDGNSWVYATASLGGL